MTDDVRADAEDRVRVSLILNGKAESVAVDPGETLLRTLRDRFDITSTRSTCGIGMCGTCTVLVDGRSISSCIMLTVQADDRAVTTSEGLVGADGTLSAVQRAFVRHGAYQCSFCIPGMVLGVHAALDDPAVPNEFDSVRTELAGNLCRCGTYPEILGAVRDLVTDSRAD